MGVACDFKSRAAGRAVRGFLNRLTRNPAAGDDLAGELLLRVVQAAPAYEPREREAAWVFRIAQNVWRDGNRRRIRSVEDARAADVASPADELRAGLGFDPWLIDRAASPSTAPQRVRNQAIQGT